MQETVHDHIPLSSGGRPRHQLPRDDINLIAIDIHVMSSDIHLMGVSKNYSGRWTLIVGS